MRDLASLYPSDGALRVETLLSKWQGQRGETRSYTRREPMILNTGPYATNPTKSRRAYIYIYMSVMRHIQKPGTVRIWMRRGSHVTGREPIESKNAW